MADDRIDLLRVHKSTRGLDDAEIGLLAEHVEVVRCQEGDVIHRPDETVTALLLVAAGRLTMTAVSATGVETPFRQIGRDDQFGLLMLPNQDPLPILVTAELNTTLLRIPQEAAQRLVIELPIWRRNLVRTLGPGLMDAFLKNKQPKRQRIVGFVHLSEDTRELTQSVLRRLSQLGEKVGLLSDREATSDDKCWKSELLLDSAGRPKTLEELRGTIADWHEADRVVADANFETIAEYLPELTDACEALFWVCPDESVARVFGTLGSLVRASPARQEKLFVIRILGGREQAAQLAPELELCCEQDFKVHWNSEATSPVCSRQAGIERIIHHLRGVSLGLALGGGAARGMAHLGVLQVLEKAGIVVDRMSGTSAGALTGVLYAAGYSANFQVEAFARDLNPPWYYRLLPYGDAWFLLGKYRLGGWDGMLRKYLHSWHLEQLAIPFSAVSADLVQARQIIRETGDAALAILESINLPVLSRPICRDGMTLVDGGVLNVVPADVLAAQDANVVIASDVAARIGFEFAGNRPDTPTDKMKVPSSAQTAVRMRTVQDRNLRSVGGGSADIIIEPDVSQVLVTDFKRAPKTAELGKVAAEAALPEILGFLNHMDAQLFPLRE